ncbi:hypothetical protein [Embleya sp. NBC_00896]|uniref:hypothetical protein n=1 Tax=Embleya sp. NBC_00896 TaxID=2975961 RepID=UPI003867EC38|nr:hypothetical protein OG928_17640 [Embleya sp. NBC_00896]
MRTTLAKLGKALAVSATAVALTLATPIAAHAETIGQTPTQGATTGTAVTISSGIVVAILALILAHRKGVLFLATVAFAAGVMLSGTQIAASLSQVADRAVHAGVDAVTGAVA